MAKLIKLSGIGMDKVTVHPFGTLALLPALRSEDLKDAANSNVPHAIQLDNGFYYVITPEMAMVLFAALNAATHTAGLPKTVEALKHGSGMVWNKGSNNPYSYLSVMYQDQLIVEQRFATQILSLA